MFFLKNSQPTNNTKIGVTAFKVPESELLILLPAVPKTMAGRRYPNKPERKITPTLSDGKSFRFLIAQGMRNVPATKILPAPISIPVKAAVSFLIKRNDKPQAMAKIIKMAKDCCFLLRDTYLHFFEM